MGLLTSNLSKIRNDPRLFRLPPYLALLCMLGGIIWICLLPLDEYSRRTYVSENALLPGQVHTYFHGSEQNIFRAYKQELSGVLQPKSIDDEHGNPTGQYLVATEEHKNHLIEYVLDDAGLKTARQKYSYEAAGKTYKGENIYAIVHGPRADGTESIVLVAPVKNIEGDWNVKGVTLLITLARYFSRWSLWSKDIILLVTPDSTAGPKAFVDAYHSMHDPRNVADLSLKTGHIQGAVVIDFPFDHNFETLHVSYDGINGQLPNLDLINTAVSIATGQMGIGCTIQSQHDYSGNDDRSQYLVRLKTLVRGMLHQALGHASGAHSVFMPYHIDAITLTAVGHGWQDEMAFGRTVESVTRSLNNLLEKLHQSFFFYLLLQNTRFVSIGTYLPSAMAVGAGFTIVAIFGWLLSGYEELRDGAKGEDESKPTEKAQNEGSATKAKEVDPNNSKEEEKKKSKWRAIDRPLTIPVAILSTLHLTSILSTYLLNNVHANNLIFTATVRSILLFTTPVAVAFGVQQYIANTSSTTVIQRSTADDLAPASTPQARLHQIYTLLSSLSLLILGLELTVLATLNFSLSMFIGLLSAPLAFAGYTPKTASSPIITLIKTITSLVLLIILSPPAMTLIISAADIYYFEPFRAPIGAIGRVREFLEAEAFASNVLGSWSVNVGAWAIWVPAWCVGVSGCIGSLLDVSETKTSSSQAKTQTKVTNAAAHVIASAEKRIKTNVEKASGSQRK